MDYLEFVSLPHVPTGRRLFAHKQTLERANPVTMKDVVEHAKAAIGHDKKTLQVELDRRGAPQARFGPEAVRLDGVLDRSITGLDEFFDSFIRILGPEHDIAAAAARIRKTVFPTGVGDITSLPYIQEDEAVAAVLDRLAEPSMREHLAKLPGVHGLIDAVASLHAQYHTELHKNDGRPTQEDMHEMQARGNAYLQGTVILILGYAVRTGDEAGASHVLDAVRQQVQDVRTARRRRRPPVDVNPDTGEPDLPGDDEPPDDNNGPNDP